MLQLAAALIAIASTVGLTEAAAAQEASGIVRSDASGLPISTAVRIPGAAERLLLSGQLASPISPESPADRLESYGDTRVQSANVLRKIVRILNDHGYTAGDVVRMQVFLVAEPGKEDRVQLEAFNDAYNGVFGTREQPHRPVRSLFEVARLVKPWWLVEIEVEAARAPR